MRRFVRRQPWPTNRPSDGSGGWPKHTRNEGARNKHTAPWSDGQLDAKINIQSGQHIVDTKNKKQRCKQQKYTHRHAAIGEDVWVWAVEADRIDVEEDWPTFGAYKNAQIYQPSISN